MDAPDEQVRLRKLLGMLGSSFDGERANAAQMIANMAQKKKLTITELIYGPAQKRTEQTKPPPGWREHKQQGTAILQALAKIARNAAEYEFTLTDWECRFASDVSERYSDDGALSDKQIAAARRIIAKVEKWGRQ